VDEQILADFFSRQDSVLEKMESHLPAIERDGFAGKRVGDLKRILHTLKGEAGMLVFSNVEQVCHETGSYLEQAQA